MSTSVRITAASLRVSLGQAIDYAGLFPPASLDMRTSVRNYSRYLRHPQSWALGRFVLPLSRLNEFMSVRGGVAPEPWRLSGIVSANSLSSLVSDLAAADLFNRMARGARVESVEVCVSKPEEIEVVREHQPPGTTLFFELAPEHADELLPIVSRVAGFAKLRTGGISAEAIPSVETVAAFLARCAEMGVPFKATAGLHHPLRGTHPLTYDANSPQATMHGFLNLFTASAIAWIAGRTGRSVPRATLATCFADPERANWHFGEDALTWSGDQPPVRIELDTLGAVRSNFALSFGSCSFEEPIQEMRELDLL
jgi:hypothetical protein